MNIHVLAVRSFITFSALAMLAACESDNDHRPAEQSGVFIDSVVSGSDYRSNSRSAKTDAAGVFGYLSGEMLTFSIGTLELGNAAGAALRSREIL